VRLTNRHRPRVMAEINMIPLIDVSLVLLIIFMVLTPVLFRAQIPMQLPKATQVEPTPSNENAVEVQVDRSGNVYIDKKPVPRDQLESAFKRLVVSPATQMVLVDADKDTPFQHVVTVMDAAKKAGVQRLAVAAQRDQNQAPGQKPTTPQE
jgi:biopolymer transport protein ExbD